DASDAVAAHIAPAAVRVVHLHPDVADTREREQDKSVAADAEVTIRNLARQRRRIRGPGSEGNEVDVVVAASVHFGEFGPRPQFVLSGLELDQLLPTNHVFKAVALANHVNI